MKKLKRRDTKKVLSPEKSDKTQTETKRISSDSVMQENWYLTVTALPGVKTPTAEEHPIPDNCAKSISQLRKKKKFKNLQMEYNIGQIEPKKNIQRIKETPFSYNEKRWNLNKKIGDSGLPVTTTSLQTDEKRPKNVTKWKQKTRCLRALIEFLGTTTVGVSKLFVKKEPFQNRENRHQIVACSGYVRGR